MKVGILGSGEVGQSLGSGFIKYGYDVMLGTRNPIKLAEWKKKMGPAGKIGSFAETAAFGQLIVLAAKGSAAKDTLNLAGAKNIENKTVLDTTNPIDEAAPVNGVLKFFSSLDKALMEELQEAFPNSHFVKCFNSIGSQLMVNPDLGGIKPTMFICGNDIPAKKDVSGIVEQFGFEVEDMGGAQAARAIEPLCILWCIPGFLRNDWNHAFKLLKK